MHHFHRLYGGVFAAVGHHQAGIRKLFHQRPGGRAQFLAGGHPAGVLGAFPRPHQLQKHAPRLLLLLLAQGGVAVVGMAGQGPLHPADGGVCPMGDGLPLPASPKLGEGKLQQRQNTGFGLHLLQDPLHQPGFEAHTPGCSRLLDHLAKFLRVHRPQLEIPLLQQIGEGPIGEGIAEEIGPNGEHQPGLVCSAGPGVAAIAREASEEGVEELPEKRIVGAQGVQLLELIGDQQHQIVGEVLPHLGQHIRQRHLAGAQKTRQLARLGHALGGVQLWRIEGHQGQRHGMEGVSSRPEVGEAPVAVALQPGHQPRQHHRRLATARGPQQGEEGAAADGLMQALHHGITPEEQRRVIGAEVEEAAVGAGEIGVGRTGGAGRWLRGWSRPLPVVVIGDLDRGVARGGGGRVLRLRDLLPDSLLRLRHARGAARGWGRCWRRRIRRWRRISRC